LRMTLYNSDLLEENYLIFHASPVLQGNAKKLHKRRKGMVGF
jgi:hypothetical protein